MVLEPVSDGRHKEVKVATNDSDDEEVETEGGCADLCGRQVNYDGGGHANPHLTDDVGGNEGEEAPGIGEEESSSCKWSSCYLRGGEGGERGEGERRGGTEVLQ